MAKTPIPLLSLGATGSVADSITYKRSRSTNIVQKKPRLPYFLTLPSQYQRWLYQDYAHLWTQQSVATKQSYQSSGSRHHLTGFQYWMKYHLTNLPDIAGWWKLDDNQGATTPDSSRNNNTGTIIGASPAAGLIAGCLSFDGINDRVAIPDAPSIANVGNQVSIELFFYAISQAPLAGVQFYLNKSFSYYFNIQQDLTNLIFGVYLLGVNTRVFGPSPLSHNTWYHLVGQYNGTNVKIYVNGTPIVGMAGIGDIDIVAPPLVLGAEIDAAIRPCLCRIDNAIIYTRCLSVETILRHAQRRYLL